MDASCIATVFLSALLLCTACGNEPSRGQHGEQQLVVATAANVQFAMHELEAAFEGETGIPLEVVISSSGKLTAQIQQGAPYHLLLSANMKYPQRLYKAGYAVAAPATYALGALVLWTMKEKVTLHAAPRFLTHSDIGKIAIANPKNAPYGEQAVRFFEYYGIYEQVAPKLVYGESIAQTNQYVISKACDLGLTAKSVVLSPKMRGRGAWLPVDPAAYTPIRQGVIITRYGQQQQPEACRRFYDFLFSETAQAIFRKYGYEVPG